MSPDAALVLDLLGRRCPVPVIELAARISGVEIGDIVEVVSDDPAAKVDIPVWCRMKGQEYVGAMTDEAGALHLQVRRSV
jgi:TusA-related sulfurtransferase